MEYIEVISSYNLVTNPCAKLRHLGKLVYIIGWVYQSISLFRDFSKIE